jgi:hypothetical protein
MTHLELGLHYAKVESCPVEGCPSCNTERVASKERYGFFSPLRVFHLPRSGQTQGSAGDIVTYQPRMILCLRFPSVALVFCELDSVALSEFLVKGGGTSNHDL